MLVQNTNLILTECKIWEISFIYPALRKFAAFVKLKQPGRFMFGKRNTFHNRGIGES